MEFFPPFTEWEKKVRFFMRLSQCFEAIIVVIVIHKDISKRFLDGEKNLSRLFLFRFQCSEDRRNI